MTERGHYRSSHRQHTQLPGPPRIVHAAPQATAAALACGVADFTLVHLIWGLVVLSGIKTMEQDEFDLGGTIAIRVVLRDVSPWHQMHQ